MITKYVTDLLPSGELKTVGPTEYPALNWKVAAKDGPELRALVFLGRGPPPPS